MAAGTRYTGKVKSFNVQKGFGFITCPKVFDVYGADVYLHAKSVEISGLDPQAIDVGAMVSFEVHLSPQGKPQANNIKVISPGAGVQLPAAHSTDSLAGNGGGYSKGSKSTTGASAKGGHKDAWGGSKDPWGSGKGSWANANESWGKAKTKGGGVVGNSGGSKSSGAPVIKVVVPAAATAQVVAPPARDGGKGTDGKGRGPVKATHPTESAVVEAVKMAVGEAASVELASGVADDGTPLIQLSLTTLNSLLQAAGHAIVEGSSDVPDENEGLPGYDGSKVAGPWFCGTLKEYFPEQAYGSIESKAFKEQYGDKELFVHAEHLNPEGEMLVKRGEDMIFPLVEDEDGNSWAWSPLIPKSRDFLGTVRQWGNGFGFLKCETLWPVFEEDIYVHAQAAEYYGCQTHVGAPIVFNLHMNKEGKPQASSPRPPGTIVPVGANAGAKRPTPPSAPPPGKRSKVESAGNEDAWYQGRVKSFNDMKGYGFIECPELRAQFRKDVFMHGSLKADGVNVGEMVSFQIHFNQDGNPQASRIVIGGEVPGGADQQEDAEPVSDLVGDEFQQGVEAADAEFFTEESHEYEEPF